MDLSILDNTDADSLMQLAEIAAIKENRLQSDNKIILIRVFLGGSLAAQVDSLQHALLIVVKQFLKVNVTVKVEYFTNDVVRNTLKWTVYDLIHSLLESDIHLIGTHLHQGNVAKSEYWNMQNISSNIDRLQYHLGIPMGKYIHCPVFRQDKLTLYECLNEFSAPTIGVSLNDKEMSDVDLIRITSFVDFVNQDTIFKNENEKFIVKLPYTTGSTHNATVKSCVGIQGILKKIEEFKNNDRIFGFIPYAVIQPFIHDNTEAKIICFDGKAVSRNPNKRGSSGKSVLGGPKSTPYLSKYAEDVIRHLKDSCPNLISEQMLRVDVFQSSKTNLLIVNEVEGFEAQNVGTYTGNSQFVVNSLIEEYWVKTTTKLIKYHIEKNK